MKKSEKTEITKEKILKASIEEFGKYGINGATVNQICQRYNISKGLIYHNYKNKDELYLCCVESAVNAFINYMNKYNFGTDFKHYMHERYLFFKENPYYSRLIFETILTDDPDFSNKIRTIKSKFDSFNMNIYLCAINHLKLRSGISKEDALQYYTLLQNMLNHYLSTDSTSEKYFAITISDHEKNSKKYWTIYYTELLRRRNEKGYCCFKNTS